MPPFNLSWHKVSLTLKHPFTISRGTKKSVTNVLVKLSDGKHTGIGEAAPNRRYNEDAETVIGYLESLPADIFNSIAKPEQLAATLDEIEYKVHAARAAVEMAWLDWYSKRQGQPLWKLWDAPAGTGPCTSYTIGLDDIAVMQQKVRSAEDYPIYKVKLGTDRDKEIIKALRDVTQKPIRVDANEGWQTLSEAKRMIDYMADFNIELVEQPMPAANLDEQRALKAYSPIPICADESFLGNESLQDIANAFDIINIKLMKIGSLVKARQVIQKAKACGLQVMIGCMIESSVANTAGAILSLWADYVDLDGHLLIKNDPFIGLQLTSEKRIYLPDIPGLGLRRKS